MSATEMTCMSCGRTKNWADGFPDHAYATCWECAWKMHLREKHPRVVRKARREAERRAKAKYRNEAHREVEASMVRDQMASTK